MTYREIRRKGQQRFPSEASHYIASTDFCLAEKRNRPIPQPELDLPKSYRFNRVEDPAEFMLGENLNRERQRKDLIAFRNATLKKSNRRKSKFQQLVPLRRQTRMVSKVIDVKNQKQMKIPKDILKIDETEADFQESALFEYSKTSSTMYDHAVRPFFDDSGLFPYSFSTTSNRAVITTSHLSLHTDYWEFPLQTIAKLSVFFILTRDGECLSNIVEVEMKISKPGVWKPSTFHEFDWIVKSDEKINVYVEVVALIRIKSDWRPFDLKATLIAENEFKLVDYYNGGFQLIDQVKQFISLNRNGKLTTEEQEIVLSFHVTHSKEKYPYLPNNFICPTSATPIYEKLRIMCRTYLDPFLGDFSLWSPPLITPIIFSDISASEKALSMMAAAWTFRTDKSFHDNIFKIYPSTKALSKTGSFCLLDSADSQEKATSRVAEAMIKLKIPNDEKFKPFHTDELRGRLPLSIPAIFE